jgi:hypothetical protein
MQNFEDLKIYYGDLHSHCDISYGHGKLENAFANAREQLDFCSVTGHALWPDMPEPNKENRHFTEYHLNGFKHLREVWPDMLELIRKENKEGEFVIFPGFEMHNSADGDYTIVYKDDGGEILDVSSAADLRSKLHDLKQLNCEAMAFPHHIAYKQGYRGINWQTFEEDFCPVVEIISMHGCSEESLCTHQFLHTMGPADYNSSLQAGLRAGKIFGFVGNTDHHSAHPGSYNHGRTAVWAAEKTRNMIWQAIQDRKTYALTGDRIELLFTLNGAPMGSVIQAGASRLIKVRVKGGSLIDYVDIVKNGELIKRVSQCDIPALPPGKMLQTKICLEAGWGLRGKRTDWDIDFGISSGKILSIEPRFRGSEVVSPLDADNDDEGKHYTTWRRLDELKVKLQTATFGNPNNSTPTGQAICLEVEADDDTTVQAVINGRKTEFPLDSLFRGSRTGYLDDINLSAYCFYQAPLPHQYQWELEHTDFTDNNSDDVYYIRVKQKNDQWAWSSPVFIRNR